MDDLPIEILEMIINKGLFHNLKTFYNLQLVSKKFQIVMNNSKYKMNIGYDSKPLFSGRNLSNILKRIPNICWLNIRNIPNDPIDTINAIYNCLNLSYLNIIIYPTYPIEPFINMFNILTRLKILVIELREGNIIKDFGKRFKEKMSQCCTQNLDIVQYR